MTGYEIKKRVSTSLQAVTNASYGTLYPTLHRLLEEGAVRMEEKPQTHRPARKVYEITEQGQEEFKAWLLRPPENDRIRRDFLLKLFWGHELQPQQVKSMLCERRTAAEAQLQTLLANHGSLNGHAPATQTWVREYTVEQCQTELNWLNRLIAQIEADSDGESNLGA
jgi:DNA-binding PadR family transcriptional regulator